jgi:hypothetical protein
MAALLVVPWRATPVLGQEHRQVAARPCQIGRVERSEQRLALDTVIEAVDQVDEERLAADALVQGRRGA